MIRRLLKLLIYIAILAVIGLIGYAYLGEFFGEDFTPAHTEIRAPVTLVAE